MRPSIFVILFVSSFCVVRPQTTDSTIQDIISRLDALETTSTNQDTQIQQLETQINQQLTTVSGSAVAFYAKDQPASTVNKAAHSDFIYFRVGLNEGDGYDSSTGIFTAPQSGYYYFAATAGGKNSKDNIGIYFTIDGVRATSISQSTSHGQVRFASAHLTCYLNKNQKVSVKTYYAAYYYAGDASFQGFLISAKENANGGIIAVPA